jgi:hypothetical protein
MPADPGHLLHGRIVKLALAGACALLAIAAIEIGYRIHSDRPVLVLGSWRAWRIEHIAFGGGGKIDPVLGWTPTPHYAEEDYSTLDHGIRRNFEEDTIRTGAILAVGGTFTVGDGVDDDETWPAHLERITATPVLNGGVDDYAVDQIVMRAEQLLPLVRPRTVIIGLLEEDIARAGHSSFGAPKPYFVLDKGELRFHPPGPLVVDEQPRPGWQTKARELLGYSALLDAIIDRVAPNFWHGMAGQQIFQKVDNDTVGVTCALLQRLKRRADADRIEVLLFVQHVGQTIVDKDEPGGGPKRVAACATTMGITVVDQFAGLRAIALANQDALGKLYQKGGDGYGPLSPKGNLHAAELLARALDKKR